ncbi:MAG: hypothetical protein UY48_C0008G0010 [Candidatus Gottesmanbacteria bacterium GW2011_GWB1_49_7]|uniref:Uncharacterized protein n=1 Tax=Candidatus Gottesmanbacteria bacterium GW2011_GWB1_49_7 TaxID=1618448 RepID=A0A0G1W2N2_9BACT|nr:MAG: hypothetical protein UY48_C0008G0010 [Candidatus Gottesmanbacteria bacterium GW2011_GWB1_49_7]
MKKPIENTTNPTVTRRGILNMQVCVPSSWNNDRITQFANANNPCGTRAGWFIRKKGSPYLSGDPERCPCESRANFVHVMLDA